MDIITEGIFLMVCGILLVMPDIVWDKIHGSGMGDKNDSCEFL